MGVSERLAAAAVHGAHALVVEVPGWWTTRAAVERELASRGWRAALSPADADVLVVCGTPGERLAGAVDRVWAQLPGPRVRVTVADAHVADRLDDAAALLADVDHQRRDAEERDDAPEDSGGGEMAPAGIPLAEGADDRDGLEMDALHVPLGPVLPLWPAGLVLRCVLHGDVVAEAEVEVLAGAGGSPADGSAPAHDAARACDGAARLLALAGGEGAAAASVRIRDALLVGEDPGIALSRLDRVRARVARSVVLRWSLRGLGHHDGLDVRDRLLGLLDRARAALRDERVDPAADVGPVLRVLPELVTGLDLAAVRLVVASLDADTAAATRDERARA